MPAARTMAPRRWAVHVHVLVAAVAMLQLGVQGEVETASTALDLRVNLMTQPVISPAPGTPLYLTWAVPPQLVQTGYEVLVIQRNGTIHQLGFQMSSEPSTNITLGPWIGELDVMSVGVCLGLGNGTACNTHPSPFLKVLSGPAGDVWEGAQPIWGTKCSATARPGHTPWYARMRSSVGLFPDSSAVLLAVVSVTASSPYWLSNAHPDHKILAGYRLRLRWGDRSVMIGVGPGRSPCDVGVSTIYGCPAAKVYDTYDVTNQLKGLVPAAGPPTVTIEIDGFGLEQPGEGIHPAVQLKMHVYLAAAPEAKVVVVGTGAHWQGFDLDPMYNPSGSFGGGFWFFAPHENIDARCDPAAAAAAAEDGDMAPSLLPAEEGGGAGAERAPGTGATTVCATGFEANKTNPVLQCPPGQTLATIDFASYGTPGGACGAFTYGTCDQPSTRAAVVTHCLGLPNCTIPIGGGRSYFYGDPCPGTSKRVFIQAQCSGDPLPGPCSGCWMPAVVQPALPRLVPKTVAPLYETYIPVNATWALGVGRLVADPGREIQGGVMIELFDTAALSGSTIEVRLGEELLTNGSVMYQMRTGNTYRSVWTLRKGSQTLSFQEYREFRYAELQLRAPDGTPAAWPPAVSIRISFNWIRYPKPASEQQTVLAVSDPNLQAVWDLCDYTVEATTLDMYPDSNTRQRSIDCQADETTALLGQFATTSELGYQRMITESMMLRGPQGYTSETWADWTVLPLMDVYYTVLHTGDVAFGRRFFEDLYAAHTYLSDINSTTHLVTKAGLSALIDTSGGSDDGFHQSPTNAVVNAWVYHALTALAQLGTWTGADPAKLARLTEAAAQLKAGFNALLFNGTAICDGICSETPHTSVHSSFYALAFGVVAGKNLARVWGYVRARSQPESALGMPNGAYPAQFMLLALYANAQDQGAAALATLTSAGLHSWRGMLAQNATCTLECWSDKELPNMSRSHVWSSSPSFIVPERLFGVRPLEPGFRRFAIQPQPGSLASGTLILPTVRGPVHANFSREGGDDAVDGPRLALSVQVPGNTVAEVALPVLRPSDVVLVNGRPVDCDMDAERATAHLALSGGRYTLTSAGS